VSWEYYDKHVPLEALIGKTLAEVTGSAGDDEMVFKTDAGEVFKMYHSQDCCESVSVNDIEGDLADLLGSPIVLAEESTSSENPAGMPPPEYQDDSFTWTFYRIATAKGFVVIRWYGESNGYYSEGVDFAQLN
jgi:hypothetical protein